MAARRTQDLLTDLIAPNEILTISSDKDVFEIVRFYLNKLNTDESFSLVNLADLTRQYEKWVKHFPNVKPHYAVKCNPDHLSMVVLHRLTCGFDCASMNEIKKALQTGLSPEDIVYAHPAKPPGMIQFSKETGVDLFTIDSEQELNKMKKLFPNSRLLIRISTDDSSCLYPLSSKFGCDIPEAESLLKLAKEMSMNIVGVAFHVGSGFFNPDVFFLPLKEARHLFEIGEKLGFSMTLLDIGGGFLGVETERNSLEIIGKNFKLGLEQSFKDWMNLSIISEPGQYFVTTGHTVVTRVINKRYKTHAQTGQKFVQYVLNDTIYNTFYCAGLGYSILNESNTFPLSRRNRPTIRSEIYGATCSPGDVICPEIMLPDLDVGEYLVHINMGAYNASLLTGTTTFAGFNKAKTLYYIQ